MNQSELFKTSTFEHQSRFAPRLLSLGIHVSLVGLALVPWVSNRPRPSKLTETAVALRLVAPMQQPGRTGGGGGGKRQPTPASRGVLPRAAEKQFVPPDPEPSKNPNPELTMEPTLVAPQLASLRPVPLLNIGDPNGVISAPSSGMGGGGGIGDNGDGRGIGNEEGAGAGPGSKSGCCGNGAEGTFTVGGDVSAPTVVYRVDPEYSEAARKARYEGTVVLQAVVRKDGRVDVLHLVRSLGYGLDQNAMDALKQWRFRPAMKGSTPVDATVNIEVRFSLR